MNRIFFLAAVALSAFIIIGASSPQTAEAAKSKIFKVSHNQQPTHPVHQALIQFKGNVEKRSNGSLTVDLYPSGTLADDVTGLDQVALGTIQGAVIMFAPGTLIGGKTDGLRYIEDLPFLFPDSATARKAYDGPLGEAFTKMAANHGIQVLCYWENGFRHMTNNKRPIFKPEDMSGIKFRISPSEIRQLTFNALKANAIPMAFTELFTGLQQGTVDGQENPLSIIVTSKFYEVQKYLSLSRHIYSAATFIVNPAFFEGLSKDEQLIVEEESLTSQKLMRKLNDEFEATAIKELKERGMEVNEVDVEAFRQAVKPVWNTFIERYGKELIDLALSVQ